MIRFFIFLFVFVNIYLHAYYCWGNIDSKNINNSVFECFESYSSPIKQDKSKTSCRIYFTDPWTIYDENKIMYNLNNYFYFDKDHNRFSVSITCFADLFDNLNSFFKGCSNFKQVDYLISYCKPSENLIYSTYLHAWVDKDTNEVICPFDKVYDSKQEKCIIKPNCPSGTKLHEQAIQKCGGEEFIKSEMCNPDTGDVNITCKSCYEIGQGIIDYCRNVFDTTPRSDAGVVCQENQDGSVTINITDYTPDLCDIKDNNETNNTSGNSSNNTDNNSSDSNSTSNDSNNNQNNGSDNSGGTGSTGDNSNDSTTPPSDSDDNQCPNPCSIADNVGTETRTEGNCHIITKPVYENCTLKYHVENGKCVPGCDDNSDDSNDLNATKTLNDISGKLNTVNANLKSINDTLNSIKSDLESNISIDTSIIGTVEKSFDDVKKIYTDGYDNFKKNISSIQSKFSELKNMFSGERKIDFSVEDTECFKLNIWGKTITFNLCKPLSYLSPIITFVLTIILNFYLIIFAIKTLFKE